MGLGGQRSCRLQPQQPFDRCRPDIADDFHCCVASGLGEPFEERFQGLCCDLTLRAFYSDRLREIRRVLRVGLDLTSVKEPSQLQRLPFALGKFGAVGRSVVVA